MERLPYKYEDSKEFYEDYYDEQVGNGLSVYTGRSIVPSARMTGDGFGSVLAKLARKALPYAKVVGKRLLSGTAGLAGDLLSGQDFETAAKRRLTTAGRDIVSDFSRSEKKPARRVRKKTVPRRGSRQTGKGGGDVFG